MNFTALVVLALTFSIHPAEARDAGSTRCSNADSSLKYLYLAYQSGAAPPADYLRYYYRDRLFQNDQELKAAIKVDFSEIQILHQSRDDTYDAKTYSARMTFRMRENDALISEDYFICNHLNYIGPPRP